MSIGRHHAEWLSLIEVSGPFLTLPVLVRVLPQGLPKTETGKLGQLRAAYEEWAEAQRGKPESAAAIHESWVQLVLSQVLEFDSETLRGGNELPSGLELALPEHHEAVRPSMAVVEPTGRAQAGTARLLIATWPRSQDLEEPVPGTRWAGSPLERMTQLCRATNVRLGLVTNGERWTLVDAPVGQTAGYASWYAGLWLQEPMTLAAFETLLGVRRFFAAAETDTLEGLLRESVAYQQEVTDQLGYQVRRAVEVLVQALDRADLDRERELLNDVRPERLYEAALTVMMRLVFLFCAEERGLLLLGDETYDLNYAVSTLRAQLREEADVVGVEVLERRQDAWARLLATFRAVYGGIEHEALRLPALGGSLFDPDRFPFLEGRSTGTSWLDTPASPLPIDNRTVLHLLEALQLLKMKGGAGTSEARKLSYRALDIEQIGHVYEGLLDHVAIRIDSDTLGLRGSKDKEPEISIADLDRERRKGHDDFVEFLKEQTGRSVSGLRNDLEAEIDEETEQRLLIVCGNDKALVKRIAPYHALLRQDVWGYPQVYRASGFMVTGGSERRQTGTHYTPKSLTEQIVAETLEPLVYEGPADGKTKAEWRLRTPAELLDLKICDMAMGSAAFLVQVCRWLGERLVEAWEAEERTGSAISADGEVLAAAAGHDLLAQDRDERLSLARRLIAERCVYGVDINPMAVELAKLSLWLVTLAKGRPFGFLDHNLRCGDSLLGVTSLEQVETFHLDPAKGRELHHGLFDPGHLIRLAVGEALKLRARLRVIPILDIHDVHNMETLNRAAGVILKRPNLAADMLVGAALDSAGRRAEAFDRQLVGLSGSLLRLLTEDDAAHDHLLRTARDSLDMDCPERLKPRRVLHWPIEFPEVFQRERIGFDAILGNPPFLGGKRLKSSVGTRVREYLVDRLAGGVRGSADLVAYFFLRAYELLRPSGAFGFIAVNTIAQGETREVGLDRLIHAGASVISAYPNEPWPGNAAVITSRVHIVKGPWQGQRKLSGRAVPFISAYLSGRTEWVPQPLNENLGIAYSGSYVLGKGFVLSEAEARSIIANDPKCVDVIFPFLNGEDLNSDPAHKPSRWVINFWDWPEEKTRRYNVPHQIVEQKVKPERQRRNSSGNYALRKPLPERWWQYADKRPALYHAIGRGEQFLAHPKGWRRGEKGRLEEVICIAATSRTARYALVPNTSVFSHALYVLARGDYGLVGLLWSELHRMWLYRYCSTLKTDLRFVPTDGFETYPFPAVISADVADIGEQYFTAAHELMTREKLGLTSLFGRVDDPKDDNDDIVRLRQAQIDLDYAALQSYELTSVKPRHGFYQYSFVTEDTRVRFTVDPESQEQILASLSDLNKGRFEAEKLI
jgi:hypothetical protein